MSTLLNTLIEQALKEKETKLLPENIKKGVTVFNVTGTSEGGEDSSDATATSDDLISPKTAYAKGEKITGNLVPIYKINYEFNASIEDNNIVGIKIINPNYLFIWTKDYQFVMYSINQENHTLSLLDKMNIKETSQTLTDLNKLTISDLNSVDGDIRICLPRTDRNGTIYYYKFDTLSNKFKYVTSLWYTDSRYSNGGFSICISKTGKYLLHFFVQSSDDYSMLNIIKVNSDSFGDRQQLYHVRYGHTVGDMQFVNNDSKMLVLIDSIQYQYSIASDGTISKIKDNSTDIDLIVNDSLTYGYTNGGIYTLSVTDEGIDKNEKITKESISASDFNGFIGNKYYIKSNKIYSVENVSTPLYNGSDISIGLNDTSFVDVLSTHEIKVVTNIAGLSTGILESLDTPSGILTNVADISVPSNAVLSGHKFVNYSGIAYGEMPNNGQLNYKMKEEEQVIPLGYTSGGVIEPADITKLTDYKNCLKISDLILSGEATKPYIQYTSDMSYTNLGITPNKNYKYEIHFDDTLCARGVNTTVFGSWDDNAKGCLFGINEVYYQIADDTVWENLSQTYEPGQHILTVSNASGYELDGVFLQEANIQENGLQMWLNRANFSNCSGGFNGKIFEFIVYDENEEIIFDAIPNISGTFYDKIGKKSLITSGDIVYGYTKWTGYIEPTYTELDHIDSYRQSYINTEYRHNENTKIEIKFMLPSSNTSQYCGIFGARDSNYRSHAYVFFARFNGSRFCYNRTGQETTGTAVYGRTITLTTYRDTANYITDTGESYSITTSGSLDNGVNDLLLCNINTAGTNGISLDSPDTTGLRIYYCKIWDDDGETLVRDFIPCEASNGYVGLYDKVSKKFFKSGTMNNFIAGSEVGPIEEV